jgi:autotransporter-associated beta strand protein
MLGDFNNSSAGRCAGVFDQSGGTVSVGTSAARPQWSAIGGSGIGLYNISGGTLNAWINGGLNVADTDQNGNAGEGALNITGGAVNVTELWAGKIGRAQGVISQSNGTVTVGVGDFVDLVSGGGAPATGPDDSRLALGGFELGPAPDNLAAESTGTYNLTGGTLRAAGINIGSLARGFFNQSGGTATAEQGVIIARAANNVGTLPSGVLNLNGGTFQTLNIVGGAGFATVNFNGGLLKALANQAPFIDNIDVANVAAGGARIDSNGFTVSSAQILSGPGGLTKQGAGTLALSGVNTYAGTTTVQAGRLVLALPAQGPVFAGAGADIQGGRLILDYTGGASPAPAVLLALDAGFDQTPKFSSGPLRTTNPPSINRGLGWIDDTANSQVIVGYTYYGDLNLDGQVDVADLGTLATNWQSSGNWGQGDFTYDGVINVADLGELATNWQQGVGNPLGPTLDSALASLGLARTAVPEPASIAAAVLVTLAAASSRSRRRTMP